MVFLCLARTKEVKMILRNENECCKILEWTLLLVAFCWVFLPLFKLLQVMLPIKKQKTVFLIHITELIFLLIFLFEFVFCSMIHEHHCWPQERMYLVVVDRAQNHNQSLAATVYEGLHFRESPQAGRPPPALCSCLELILIKEFLWYYFDQWGWAVPRPIGAIELWPHLHLYWPIRTAPQRPIRIRGAGQSRQCYLDQSVCLWSPLHRNRPIRAWGQ